MKLSRILLSLAALFCASQFVHADILILKNGEKKEGNILEEKPDAVRMKYKITPKIWDEKDFPRADIAQIIKQKPEEIEIVELRKVLPTDDLLTADQYEQIIQDKLRPFINKFPGTTQATEVEAMLAELQKEKDRIVSGEVKMEGQWLTADMVKRDDYNIQAYKVRRAMQKKAAEIDYTGALRDFDRLASLDNGFPASLHYVKAIPEAIDIMTKYEAVISRMSAEQPIIQRQRDDSMKKLVEPDLGRTKAAIAREVDGWKATYDAEKKSKVTWMTQYKYDIKALQLALKQLVTERGKLQLIDLSRLQAQNEALTKTLRYLADENYLEADAAYKAAQLVALKESSSMMSQIRTRISALKAEQAKNKNASRIIGAGSTAVSGSAAPIQDDRVAQAMADAEKQKEDKKAAGDDLDKKADAEKPADDKGDAAAKPKSKSTRAKTSDSAAAIAPAAEESSMQTYLLIGAGILILVLLVSLVAQKKKAK